MKLSYRQTRFSYLLDGQTHNTEARTHPHCCLDTRKLHAIVAKRAEARDTSAGTHGWRGKWAGHERVSFGARQAHVTLAHRHAPRLDSGGLISGVKARVKSR